MQRPSDVMPLPTLARNLLLSLAILLASMPVGAKEPTPQALEQIQTLLAWKAQRTASEEKIDTRLLSELALRGGELSRTALPQLRTGIQVEPGDRVLLDIEATVEPPLLAALEDLGAVVVNAHPRFGTVRLRLPLAQVKAAAALPGIRSLRPADVMITQMINVTEGDVAHTADLARTNFGVDGSGVKVGVISDSVDALADLQASGDLPPGVTILAGQSGNPGTSEGTALMEIVHDMAPGAELFFATGSGGQAQLAQNILDLKAAGCSVIVDDVLYLGEPVFQDGIIAQAVDQVVAMDGIYFSAAGNSGNLTNDESGVWEGDYAPTAVPAPLAGAALSAHDFGTGAGNEITMDPPALITLQWADPQDGAGNDLDLFLLDAALANVIAASTNTQNGDDDPLEAIDSSVPDDTGNHVVVTLFAGAGRFLHVNTHRGRLDQGTDGQIFGHPAAEGAIAVAAVGVATAGGGPFTGGAANPVQFFSSDGPRRIFFEADGSPIAGVAGDQKGIPNSEVRQKPDIAAADGVSTATPGFNPFFGSSASAPHSAAIAALLRSFIPSAPNGVIFDNIFDSPLDIMETGIDRDSGAGILMAEDALDSMSNNIFADGFESGDATAWTDQSP